MDEVIQSIEVIETETGYRIEIKGNKEFIKQWVKRFQPGFGRQPQGEGEEGQAPFGYGGPWQRHWGHHGHHGHPGFGGFRRRGMRGAPWWFR